LGGGGVRFGRRSDRLGAASDTFPDEYGDEGEYDISESSSDDE